MKCTLEYNTHAQILFSSLNLLFSDVAIAVLVFLRPLMKIMLYSLQETFTETYFLISNKLSLTWDCTWRLSSLGLLSFFLHCNSNIQTYTCQLSCLRCESHACGLKTLISCWLTLAGLFLTPDWKIWVVAFLLDTISRNTITQTHVRNENRVKWMNGNTLLAISDFLSEKYRERAHVYMQPKIC